jgi:hypothetical protein
MTDDNPTPSAEPQPDDAFTRAAKRRRDPAEGLVRLTKSAPSIIPVCTPKPLWYVRASRDDDMSHVHDLVHADALGRDTYYFPENDAVVDAIRAIDPRIIRSWRLTLGMTRQKMSFLWKCGMPGEDGSLNSWHASAAEMIELAKEQWITLTSNQQSGSYDYRVADRDYGEPEWLTLEWSAILRLAFRRYLIREDRMEEHPVFRFLHGKA